jgi:hypothetical protein
MTVVQAVSVRMTTTAPGPAPFNAVIGQETANGAESFTPR